MEPLTGGIFIATVASRIVYKMVEPVVKPVVEKWTGTVNDFYNSFGLLPGKDASAKMKAITSQNRNQRDALSSRMKKQQDFEKAEKYINFAVWKEQYRAQLRMWEVQQGSRDAIEQSMLDFHKKCKQDELQHSRDINKQYNANVFPLDTPSDHWTLNGTATPTTVPFRIFLVETSDHNIFNTSFKESFAQYVRDLILEYEDRVRCTIQFGIWKTKDSNGQDASFNKPAHINALYLRLQEQPTLIINPICDGNILRLDIIHWSLEQGKTEERLYKCDLSDFCKGRGLNRLFHSRTSVQEKFNSELQEKFNREYGAGVAHTIAHIIDCHFLNEYGEAPLLPRINAVPKDFIDNYRTILYALTVSDKFQDKIFSVYYGVAKAIKADQESARKIVYDAVALWAYRKYSLNAAPDSGNSEALEYRELGSFVECTEQIERLATVEDLPFLKETAEIVRLLDQTEAEPMKIIHKIIETFEEEKRLKQERAKEIKEDTAEHIDNVHSDDQEKTNPIKAVGNHEPMDLRKKESDKAQEETKTLASEDPKTKNCWPKRNTSKPKGFWEH